MNIKLGDYVEYTPMYSVGLFTRRGKVIQLLDGEYGIQSIEGWLELVLPQNIKRKLTAEEIVLIKLEN